MTGRNQWTWRPRLTQGTKPPRHQTTIERAGLGHYTVHLKTHPDTIIGHIYTRNSVFYDAHTNLDGLPLQKIAEGFPQEVCLQRLYDRFRQTNPTHPTFERAT